MRRKASVGILFICTAILFLCFVGMVSAKTCYVPDDHSTIQAAVDAANAGDTIIVRDGLYTENIYHVDKQLTIQSENGAEATIIQAARSDLPVFGISADHVSIRGFTVKGATGLYYPTAGKHYPSAGIRLDDAENCDISNNYASNNGHGILLALSSNNTIIDNIANSNNADGIQLCYYSNNNTIMSNNASNNGNGISLYDSSSNTIADNNAKSNNYSGICLGSSSNNIITGNNASNNAHGIGLYNCSSSTIAGNNVNSNNMHGLLLLSDSSSNNIYLNNFIGNSKRNVYSLESTNIWNSTSKITYIYNEVTYENYRGNYWHDYRGSDANNDGIGDTPYPINSDKDNYPLMNPYEKSDHYEIYNKKTTYSGEDSIRAVYVFTLDGGMTAEVAVEKALASLNCTTSHQWFFSEEGRGPRPIEPSEHFLKRSIDYTIELYDQYTPNQNFPTVVLSSGNNLAGYAARVTKAPVLPMQFLVTFKSILELEKVLDGAKSDGYTCYAVLGPDFTDYERGWAWIKLLKIPEEYEDFFNKRNTDTLILVSHNYPPDPYPYDFNATNYWWKNVSGGSNKKDPNTPEPGDIYIRNETWYYENKGWMNNIPQRSKCKKSDLSEWESGLDGEHEEKLIEFCKSKNLNLLHIPTAGYYMAPLLMHKFYLKNDLQARGIVLNNYATYHPFYESKIQYIPLVCLGLVNVYKNMIDIIWAAKGFEDKDKATKSHVWIDTFGVGNQSDVLEELMKDGWGLEKKTVYADEYPNKNLETAWYFCAACLSTVTHEELREWDNKLKPLTIEDLLVADKITIGERELNLPEDAGYEKDLNVTQLWHPTPTPEENGIPGFEAVFAIAGLLVVAYLLRRRK